MKDYAELFAGLSTFMSAITSRKVNKVFADKLLESRKDSDRYKKFAGTDSFEEAINLCRRGWQENLDDFKAACTWNKLDTVHKTVTTVNMVGYAPHVPNAILGRPDCMFQSARQPVKTPVISIVINTSVVGSVSTLDIKKSAKKIMQAIAKIESQNIRVNIVLCAFSAHVPHQDLQLYIQLKKATEKLNPSRLYFALVHPSMLRRLAFAWLETIPTSISRKFIHGYGEAKTIDKYNLPRELNGYKIINLCNVIVNNWTAEQIIKKLNEEDN